jgi:large subunit ribosomal protein L19
MSKEQAKEQENTQEPAVITQDALPGVPDFRVGDTVRVVYKIVEGDTVRRTQTYEGIVISKKGSGISKTFTVRRIGAEGIGVERIFPLYSPNIESIAVVKKGKVRRAKLYYLREKTGREAMRVKERKDKK